MGQSIDILMNTSIQAGEDFDHDLTLPNIDFGTYVSFPLISCSSIC